MTTLAQLQADAEAINRASPAIRKFALDTVAYLREQAQPIPAPPPTPPPVPVTPVPVGAILFSDDFTGPLDLTKWDVKFHDRWLAANVTVYDGRLLDIVATRDTSGIWHGGAIQSLAPAHQYVGPRYLEASVKVPAGAGTFAAPLWEWAAPWGGSGIETDVSEQLGREPTQYHATVHNGPLEQFGKAIDTGINLSADFHRYGCAITDIQASYYFDGVLAKTITRAEAFAAGLSAWPFTTTPMCCVIDLDIGGTWAGPVSVSPPVHMLVEYVRVWSLA